MNLTDFERTSPTCNVHSTLQLQVNCSSPRTFMELRSLRQAANAWIRLNTNYGGTTKMLVAAGSQVAVARLYVCGLVAVGRLGWDNRNLPTDVQSRYEQQLA